MRTAPLLALVLLASAAARAASSYPPITNRDFTLDLYTGAVLGSSRIIGMGGTALALAEGSAYVPENVAAAAVRPATSRTTWDWDFHLDWLNPSLGADFDNNGDPTASIGHTLLITAGVLGQYREWALAIGLGVLEDQLEVQGQSPTTEVDVTTFRIALARTFLDGALSVGLGLKTTRLTFLELAGGQTLFDLGGGSLELGAVWRPDAQPFRLGVSASLPVVGDTPTTQGCDPNDCDGFILPSRVVVPWRLSAGAAWRFGPTPWNQKVDARWRDERAVTVALDLVLSGAVDNGYGLEEFIQQRLQPSGRGASLSVRAGAEYEWIPGWLRVRGGTYFEPGRFEGVSGREHLTFGGEVRLFAFHLLGFDERLRLAITADLAHGYGNGALSIGFW